MSGPPGFGKGLSKAFSESSERFVEILLRAKASGVGSSRPLSPNRPKRPWGRSERALTRDLPSDG